MPHISILRCGAFAFAVILSAAKNPEAAHITQTARTFPPPIYEATAFALFNAVLFAFARLTGAAANIAISGGARLNVASGNTA